MATAAPKGEAMLIIPHWAGEGNGEELGASLGLHPPNVAVIDKERLTAENG